MLGMATMLCILAIFATVNWWLVLTKNRMATETMSYRRLLHFFSPQEAWIFAWILSFLLALLLWGATAVSFIEVFLAKK